MVANLLLSAYVVYGAAQEVLYRSVHPPVDLSFPLHQTVPAVVPGATLVFSPDDGGCEFEVNDLARYVQQEQAARAVRAPRAPRG
ncbi:MAG: hypothetical protein PHU77_14130 [Simplicispira sp.]|nr:hypothetical protein [Simplicispira sp.]